MTNIKIFNKNARRQLHRKKGTNKALCVLITLLSIVPIIDAGSIVAKFGIVEINGLKNCSVDNYGESYFCDSCGTLPGRWFGIIKYKCSEISGVLISKAECMNCGLFCRYNEAISGCEQSNELFAMGVFVGFILAITLVKPVCVIIKKVTSWCSKNLEYTMQLKKDKAEMKAVSKLNRRMGQEVTPQLNDLNYKRIGTKRSAKIDAKRILLVSILMMPLVLCDDMTYYLSTSGKYCKESNCVNKDSSILMIVSGSTIKINSGVEVATLTVTKTNSVTEYVAIYNTGEPNVDVNYKSNCKGAGGCEAGTCHNDYIYESLKANDKCLIEGFGCDPSSLGNPTWWGCTHHRMCVWYRYCFKRPLVLYKVYKAVRRFKELVLLYESENIKREIILSDVSPQHNVFDSIFSNQVSVQLLSTVSADAMSFNFGIVVEDVFYLSDASEYNSPEIFKLGDYQSDLDSDNSVYPINYISCFATNTSAKCVTPEPFINIFKRSLNNYKSYNNYEKGSLSLTTRDKIDVSATIMLSNLDIKNIMVNDAICEFSVDYTFSCYGCTEESFVTFKSVKVKVKGMMKFSSNCSFETNLMPCGEDNFILRYQEFDPYCSINVHKTNQTINIVNNKTLKRHLSELRSMSYEGSFSSEVRDAMTNTNFLTGLSATLAGATLITTILTIIYRLGQLYIIRTTIKPVN